VVKEPPDLVIASDVVYDWRRVPDLIKTLKMISMIRPSKGDSEGSQKQSPTILVAIQRHDNESYEAFYEGIEDFFEVTRVCCSFCFYFCIHSVTAFFYNKVPPEELDSVDHDDLIDVLYLSVSAK